MALLKFPFPRSNPSGEAAPPADSVEALRRRARHRLIGAVALVLAAVIGFPLVFDTQPRPVSVDVPIVIPDRNKVAPLPSTAPAAQPTSLASGAGGASAAGTLPAAPGATPSATPATAPQPSKPASVSAQASLDEREELVAQKKQEKQVNPSAKGSSVASHSIAKPVAAASVAKPPATPASAAARKPAPEAAPPARDDGARARALLEGKDAPKASPAAAPPASAGSARYIVQVGAFADATKARETRLKVEHAGMTTYTQVAETAEGKRIRVRVGPFTDRAEAEKAAARVRALGLPAALLTL
jgi:DedD protein